MIISVFKDASSALCHEDIEHKLTGKIDRVTIYRILNSFCEEGRMHKIAADNGKTYYAMCQHCSKHKHNDNHMHFKCLRCGKFTCMDESIEVPTFLDGHVVLNVLYTVSGHCPNCLIPGK